MEWQHETYGDQANGMYPLTAEYFEKRIRLIVDEPKE